VSQLQKRQTPRPPFPRKFTLCACSFNLLCHVMSRKGRHVDSLGTYIADEIECQTSDISVAGVHIGHDMCAAGHLLRYHPNYF
jgi:hypothetical protein